MRVFNKIRRWNSMKMFCRRVSTFFSWCCSRCTMGISITTDAYIILISTNVNRNLFLFWKVTIDAKTQGGRFSFALIPTYKQTQQTGENAKNFEIKFFRMELFFLWNVFHTFRIELIYECFSSQNFHSFSKPVKIGNLEISTTVWNLK